MGVGTMKVSPSSYRFPMGCSTRWYYACGVIVSLSCLNSCRRGEKNSAVRTGLLAQHGNWDNTTFILFHHTFVFVMPPPNAAAATQRRPWGRSSPPPPPRCCCCCCGGRCALGTEMASCGSSCDNDRGRVRVHYGTIYVLDEFWWWMTSIAILVCPPLRRCS
jgi:hypothetical protein